MEHYYSRTAQIQLYMDFRVRTSDQQRYCCSAKFNSTRAAWVTYAVVSLDYSSPQSVVSSFSYLFGDHRQFNCRFEYFLH